MSAAEEGVGRAADAEVLLFGESHHLGGVGFVHADGFFGVGVLAGVEGVQRDFRVDLRRREVEDNLDFLVGEQFFIGDVRHAVEFFFRLGAFGNDVRAGDDFENIEFLGGLEIGVADHAASDDADFCGFHGVESPYLLPRASLFSVMNL
ncbi:hypothetical protein SDC9_202718 [bioreactor metagenome]|uniref:Uncharacterized protein n=1 Tax=bioreactor metagenome TaxID=1076179 RepID=A0A645IX73_9ZZZZ